MAQHALPPPLSQALARLRASLGGLESAAERHGQQKEQQNSLATELALMQDDRARLASELDSAMARADRLAKSAKEIDKRLVSMARSVKKVLGDEKAQDILGQDILAQKIEGQGGLGPLASSAETAAVTHADDELAEGH